jgi:glycosyltransferase involved in cell wall biosynthesis
LKPPKFSIVITARNEERFIGACLESIKTAVVTFGGEVEIIVVLNRCTDKTEEIAHSCGGRTIREDAKNLSKIRNAGARAATGDYLVTIDAESTMSEGTLAAIDQALSSGKRVGGGVPIHPDRSSLTQLSCGLFWLMPTTGLI